MKTIDIKAHIIKEPLKSPFGFKGHYIDELWQTVVTASTAANISTIPGVQSPLWSDADVFTKYGQVRSNECMLAVTKYACELYSQLPFERPDIMLEKALPELLEFASRNYGSEVKTTFTLNALTGLDIALWSLWALENDINTFDGLIPEYAKQALSQRNGKLAHIPLISYGVSNKELVEVLESKTALLKIKAGYKDSTAKSHEEDMELMLEWDKKRLLEIHTAASQYSSPLSADGSIKYYIDANGRYDSPERLAELLAFAESIGAKQSIILLEEPFSQESDFDVSCFGVPIAADESAHSLHDTQCRLSQGYSAVALKPIAKTVSESFKIAAAAYEAGASCFCADLTVNPLLVEWNRQFAARLSPIYGMKSGCLEVNGNMNYARWEQLKELLPDKVKYQEPQDGCFIQEESFFDKCYLFERNKY